MGDGAKQILVGQRTRKRKQRVEKLIWKAASGNTNSNPIKKSIYSVIVL